MLDSLSQRLSKIVKTMRGQARLTEENTKDMLREVRIALLEADVALPVVREVLARIKEKAMGEEVVGNLNPGQALVGVVQRELTAIIGGDVPAAERDINLHTQPPAVILLAGLQGAGKTTMVNLLMRFYELTDGCIKIDGVPTTDIQREDVQRLFGMVLQDTWLFEGTVRENLAYNLPGVTDAQLETVCRACGLDKFVHSLPEGFDTVLSESTSISAGQKQLLTIARAMLQNAPMLILDEATSSVDTRTELLIQRAMDQLTENRTSFVIAHRLSTIKNADLILVMKDGDIIESGTHETLMQRNGFYAALYNSQFEQAS